MICDASLAQNSVILVVWTFNRANDAPTWAVVRMSVRWRIGCWKRESEREIQRWRECEGERKQGGREGTGENKRTRKVEREREREREIQRHWRCLKEVGRKGVRERG